jgi:thymidylate kinase
MSRALLICLSGIESSGKSTQLERLMETARIGGLRPVYLWTRPGYTRNLEAAKRLVRRLSGALPAGGSSGGSTSGGVQRSYPRRGDGFRSALKRRLWLSLALLDLIWVYGLQVRYWLARGRTVVCDRYLWDCLVDFRVNFPGDEVESGPLGRMLTALAPRPDVAFFLLISVEESLRRSEQRERKFRETEGVLEQRLEQYRALADEFQVPVLDGQRPAEEVAEEIQSKVAAKGLAAMSPDRS